MKASELCKLQAQERIKKQEQLKGLQYLDSCLQKIRASFLYSPNSKAFTTHNKLRPTCGWYFGVPDYDPGISDETFTHYIISYPLLVAELIKLGYKINIEKKVLMPNLDVKIVTGKLFLFFNKYETKYIPDESTKQEWTEVTVQICCKETK